MVNDQGGINGRKINLISLDNAYNPPKTLEVTRQLVESEIVLAIAGMLGTNPNTAVQKYLNTKKVPNSSSLPAAKDSTTPRNILGSYRSILLMWHKAFRSRSTSCQRIPVPRSPCST